MRRLRHLGIALAPIAVVLVLGELHAHLVGHYRFTGTQRFVWTAAYVVLLELSAYLTGMFDDQRSSLSATRSALGAALGGGIAISVLQLLLGSLLLPRAVVFGSALVLFGLYLAVGLSAQRDLRSGSGGDRVLGVLAPDEAMPLEADFRRILERPARVVGILGPGEVAITSGTGPGSPGLLLVDAGARTRATVVVLGREALADESIVAQAALLHGRGVRVRTLGLFYDEWFGKLPIADLERVSLMFDIQELHAPGYARLKRMVDLGAAVVGLATLVVIVPPVWVLDQVGNRGPLFFHQTRVGKGGEPFSILKFRTMPPAGGSEWTRESDSRIGVLGRWMRRLHVDEIPQAVNVLRGELSLVGPRPEQPRYVDELTEKIPFYDVRHLVLPGITGWAQVKFPYGASVEDALEKLQYEFFYLRHQGPMLDVRILARTVRTVLRAGGR
jgi:lipopolysaccharide/colanic/teichoic acid biosynthesis glycosyltransferase